MFKRPIYKTNNPYIVFAARGDVTGDGIKDYIYLRGISKEDSPFVQRITLVIKDGRTASTVTVPLKTDAGYSPRIFLGDFTGNGVYDILISITSGGSGGIIYYYIYSALNNIPKLLFDYEAFNEKYQYQVIYKDNYKVELINTTRKIRYIIDISYRDKEYLDEIYNPDGSLKAPVEGFINPLSGLYPIDFDSNDVYELLGYQRISGRYAADALGYLQTSLEWDKNQFIVREQSVNIFGSDY